MCFRERTPVAITFITVFIIACCAVSNAHASTPDDWIAGAQGVMQRIVPSHASNFQFVAVNATKASSPLPELYNDFFTVSAQGGIVTVTGTSGVSMVSGAYWYLKNVANCLVTWGNNGTGNQLSLPKTLPDVAQTTINSSVPIRYGWNMCTFSYSAVWWDQERWQEEIDWMALHGVNFPLALTGQEYVWVKVFERYNVSLEQLEPWFSGPAFLAWQRAGNIQGFAGPLSHHWITQQAELQQFILKQMRQLGMKPILSCFAGHVPSIARTIWPNATFTQSTSWNSFPPNETDVWYLDPADPLFTELGSVFMDVMIELFSSDHYYSCDTFNEVDPKSTQTAYLAAASAAVHNSIAARDPQGIWVMQAWLFHSPWWRNASLVKAYLSGVGNESMLVLDLNSEAGVLAVQYHQYYGKPWVWNMLHNYGGVRGVYGNLTEIATAPYTYLYMADSTMLGIGFTPEAIEQNPVMYEMLTSTFWSTQPIDTMSWLQAYVRQRYGLESPEAWSAWQLLFSAVYNQPNEPRSEIEWVPHWEQPSFGWQHGSATLMHSAFEAFLTAAYAIPNATSNGPFMYDFVDVVRQATTMFFSDAHRQLSNEGWIMQMRLYNVTSSIQAIGSLMLTLIDTLDSLLSTNPNYLFGTWTSRAQALALENETALFLYNAKNQVTLWGPQAQICDYAAKAWGGLYRDYYLRRWTYMVDILIAVSESTQTWNSYSYNRNLLAVEEKWCSNGTTYPANPPTSGPNAIEIAETLLSLTKMSTKTFSEDYEAIPNADVFGYDFAYTPTWTTDPHQLALLCNLMDDCEGFTSQGFLKKSVKTVPSMVTTTYLRRSLKRPERAHLREKTAPWSDVITKVVAGRSGIVDSSRGPTAQPPPRTPRDAVIQSILKHRFEEQ